MNLNTLNHSPRKWARTTGIFYFIIIFCGLMSGMMVRGALIDPFHADTTLFNLIQQESLFRLGFLGDLCMVIADVMVSVLFYFLLREVNQGIALLAAIFRLMQSAILGANLINLFKPILMIQGAGNLNATELSELAGQVQTQLQVFDYGYLISGVFFAINCFLMGYLLHQSAYFPKVLGWMMGAAGAGYLFNCMASFAIPSLVEISAMLMLFTAVIAELVLCVYLLVKGVKNGSKVSTAMA